jgi:uncharacterized protein
MPKIIECVVTTVNARGEAHLAPLGLIEEGDDWILAPFRPSTTLRNLEENPRATASFLDDAEIFAGLVTGKKDWPLEPVAGWPAPRLAAALAHAPLAVARVVTDEVRPRFYCAKRAPVAHRPYSGMNRAKAAVLEACILATRLSMLPRDKIATELAYLQIAVDKTAGAAELAAWRVVTEKIDAHLRNSSS